MRDAVLDVLVPLGAESEPLVPIRQIRLRVENHVRAGIIGSDEIEGVLHERSSQPGTPGRGRRRDPADACLAVVLEQAQRCHDLAVPLDPELPRAWFEITPVQFGIGTHLLDHEDVRAQLQDRVQRGWVKIGNGAGTHNGHIRSLPRAARRAPQVITRVRWAGS